MTLLIVGNTGQIARSLGEAAAARGIAFRALGRPQLDLTQSGSISAAVETAAPDYVINAAAYTAVDNAETDIANAMALNRDGAEALATVCHKHGIPIIHLSTDYVFDGSKSAPYTETDDANPLNIYGRSKLDGENAVSAAATRHIILRTSWVFSPFGRNFVKTILGIADKQDDLNIVDDQFGSPTYAPHISEGVLSIVDRLDRGAPADQPWGLFNMAGTGGTTWCGLAKQILRQSSLRGGPAARVRAIATDQYPTPAQRPANSRLDCSKLKKIYGIELPDWQSGVRECVTRLLQDAK